MSSPSGEALLEVEHLTKRFLVKQGVFARGHGSTDNSLIAFGRALVVENNYGYTGPEQNPPSGSPNRNTPTTWPGVTRIDVDGDKASAYLYHDSRYRVATPRGEIPKRDADTSRMTFRRENGYWKIASGL